MTTPTCQTCHFSEPVVGDDDRPFLECHRFPPVIWADLDGEPVRAFVTVSGDDWCGEWSKEDQ